MDSAAWYAVAVFTGREFEAVAELSGFCREVVCPTFREVRRKNDKARTRYKVDTPLVPGYVFAMVPSSAWDALYRAKPVCGVVSSPEGPTPITGRALRDMQAFFRRADLGEYDQQGADERIAPGDLLRVLFGPWEGQTVAVVKKHPHEIECEAELSLFGGVKGKMRLAYDEVQPLA